MAAAEPPATWAGQPAESATPVSEATFALCSFSLFAAPPTPCGARCTDPAPTWAGCPCNRPAAPAVLCGWPCPRPVPSCPGQDPNAVCPSQGPLPGAGNAQTLGTPRPPSAELEGGRRRLRAREAELGLRRRGEQSHVPPGPAPPVEGPRGRVRGGPEREVTRTAGWTPDPQGGGGDRPPGVGVRDGAEGPGRRWPRRRREAATGHRMPAAPERGEGGTDPPPAGRGLRSRERSR